MKGAFDLYQNLDDALAPFLASLPQKASLLVAYSGGIDSTVLLHALSRKRELYDFSLKAIHVHHGLMPEADAWTSHCQQFCHAFNIPCLIEKVSIDQNKKESIEALAREARYAVFREKIKDRRAILCLAHHADDQAETLLLQLFRGAGVKGLGAMHSKNAFKEGEMARPFLKVPRKVIVDYAASFKLPFVEDHSNQNQRFSRNFLRHKIMPLLEEQFGGIVKNLGRTAELMQASEALLKEMAQEDFKKAKSEDKNTLSIKALCVLLDERLANVLRFWIADQKIILPTAKQLTHIISDVIRAKMDVKGEVCFGDYRVCRFRDQLYLLPKTPLSTLPEKAIKWDLKDPLVLPNDLGALKAQKKKGAGLYMPAKTKTVEVAFRKGGEKILLSKKIGRQSLKKLFQDWEVPPWERDTIPLIYIDGELAAIVGFAIAESFRASTDQVGFDLKKKPCCQS